MTGRFKTYLTKYLRVIFCRRRGALALGAAVIAFALACNLEVGNPDTGDVPAAGLHSITMRLTQYESCSHAQPCNSVPVATGLPYVELRYELTAASFALSTITPKPFGLQPIAKQIELTSEARIDLPQVVSEQQVQSLKFSFSSPGRNAASWQLTGSLVGRVGSLPVRLALPLSGSGDIVGDVPMPDTGLEAVVLDPAVWFDLTSEPGFGNVLNGLRPAACTDSNSRRCETLSGVLSGMVERRVEKSFRAQGRPAQSRNIVK